ncbi:FSH1-domain-containing protein [Microstroma glucosiphilum]|uniref:FSH1-domain-containing protein n=1 Tax=Pseudomicrostroma glucosiphilum TaxID=1684307 RepID=A0A316UGF2_9BASI|nr:FSH1-domain-containing protein [Pseudomicrostroma glucosiphilum]PWN22993.1 FSH1-domain-containing protein [Pseudomicrostroma glucosiphilum]
MAQQKLRILALHGYTSNSFVLHRRFGAIRKACRNVADFVFVNGPLLVQPITSTQSLDAPDGQDEVTEDTPIEQQPRAWWRATDEGAYKDIGQSWSLLSDEIAKMGGIDGVVGFSQGACLAAIIAAAFENPSLLPDLKIPEGHPPLKFCIAISGFRSRDPNHQALFEGKDGKGISTPVLSILGRSDQIVTEDRSQTLLDCCQKSRVEWHPGGHVVPSQAPWRNFMRDFLATFTTEQQPNEDWRTVESPETRGSHGEDDEAGSGASTPARGGKRPGL